MSDVWNNVYKSDSTFFGDEPSNFALLCFYHMKSNRVTKVLELGAGHGRDTKFFASNDIEVQALDFSVIAVVVNYSGYYKLDRIVFLVDYIIDACFTPWCVVYE